MRWSLPLWVVAGDFNLILDSADKNNGRANRRNIARFRGVVDELELRDIHLHGRLYTWSNERTNPTMVKLDRVLTSVDWEERFPFCFLRLYPQKDSTTAHYYYSRTRHSRLSQDFGLKLSGQNWRAIWRQFHEVGAALMTRRTHSDAWTACLGMWLVNCRVGRTRKLATSDFSSSSLGNSSYGLIVRRKEGHYLRKRQNFANNSRFCA